MGQYIVIFFQHLGIPKMIRVNFCYISHSGVGLSLSGQGWLYFKVSYNFALVPVSLSTRQLQWIKKPLARITSNRARNTTFSCWKSRIHASAIYLLWIIRVLRPMKCPPPQMSYRVQKDGTNSTNCCQRSHTSSLFFAAIHRKCLGVRGASKLYAWEDRWKFSQSHKIHVQIFRADSKRKVSHRWLDFEILQRT